MTKIVYSSLLVLMAWAGRAQITHDYMVGGALDLVKTDNDGFLNKAQLGTEFNYFLSRNFTATGGFEVWTGDDISFVLGTRWYPNEDFFVRARGLIGENDLSIGAGWNQPLTDKIRFEAIGDFYFKGEFSIRAGVQYIFRRK